MIFTHLAPLDYVLLVLYLGAMLALGLLIGRRIRTGKDYFLAGRRLPWWAIGMSLVATDIGGTDIIGVGGAAYTHGLAVGNFEWIGCVPAMIVGTFVFIPFFWWTGVYTIPEYMERRFNASVRTALAVCWFIFMACNLGIMLLASAKMMHQLFGGNEPAYGPPNRSSVLPRFDRPNAPLRSRACCRTWRPNTVRVSLLRMSSRNSTILAMWSGEPLSLKQSVSH